MKKAADVISRSTNIKSTDITRNVSGETLLPELLHILLDTPERAVGVMDGEEFLGVVDQCSLLEGLGWLLMPRDDSSTLVVETTPGSYSASKIAYAVEDADVHLVDLWSSPGPEGTIMVTLRVRATDPSGVASSLERYGYKVVESFGIEGNANDIAMERLMSLQALLNV